MEHKFKNGEKVIRLPFDEMYERTKLASETNSNYFVDEQWVCGLNRAEIESSPNILTITGRDREDSVPFYRFKEINWCMYECMIDKLNPLLIELE